MYKKNINIKQMDEDLREFCKDVDELCNQNLVWFIDKFIRIHIEKYSVKWFVKSTSRYYGMNELW